MEIAAITHRCPGCARICVTLAALVLLASGCAEKRIVTIHTIPEDATIRIDGIEQPQRGQITQEFVFRSRDDVHRVTASRLGFKDAAENLTGSVPKNNIQLQLKVETRAINIIVRPAAAIVTVDGVKLKDEPITSITIEQPMGVDVKNNPLKHVITAERDNFISARQEISRVDTALSYTLELKPQKKNLNITTKPAGAKVYIGNKLLGVSPLTGAEAEFPVDLDSNEFLPQKLRAEKPGYDTREIGISWDNAKTDYAIDLGVKTKEVKIVTDPPGATVTIDGVEAPHGSASSASVSRGLQFEPINENGELKTYNVVVSKKTADSEWEPARLTIGWDGDKTEYHVSLKEILTRPVQLLYPLLRRTDQGWEVVPDRIDLLAMKDVTEGPSKAAPQSITRLAKGSQLGSLAISPDGGQIVYTILTSAGQKDMRSQMWVIRTDGSGGPESISDGKSLDMMPSYTPGGDQIIFSSNRGGRRMNIWSQPASGAATGISRMTGGDSNDLWPVVDSDPRPRLFYQAMVDTRSDPRIYATQISTVFQTDLATLGGQQPRISPKNDTILFTAINEQTNKHDLYRMSDRGGMAQNITNTPEADEIDASWSRDGGKIVFAADRAVDAAGQRNYDIWMIDLAKPDQPIQITSNASHDDCPVFDISGSAVFFRSNRGGEWGIWKVAVK